MRSELIRATFEAEPDDFMKLSGEVNVLAAAITESAVEAVVKYLQLTDLDFQIADEAGVTREELIEKTAYDRLTNPELIKKRDTATSATELLADRILREAQRTAKADKERNVSKAAIRASAMAAVEDELEPTELELKIAAGVGITRDQLMEQKALDRLQPEELKLMRTGMTAIQVLAHRIVQ